MGNDIFITEDFLLLSEPARRLYHEYAEGLPIIDYHCHLPPADVAKDRRFRNLTELWLEGDHYKWRQMRTNGIAERYCTGDASPREKFQKFAESMPKMLGNPLYHWSHLELKRYFGISDRLLDGTTAEGIWNEVNAMLQDPSFSARGLMRKMKVVLVCTTDDPTDTLEHHQKLAADPTFPIQVLPTFRPDKAMAIEHPEAFRTWVEKLAQVAQVEIRDLTTFLEALRRRHDFFHAVGCRLSDHGLTTVFSEEAPESEIRSIFNRVREGKAVSEEEGRKFKSFLLYEFAVMNAEKGWTQQIHYGALRNNNRRLFRVLGPDIGCDSIGDWPVAEALSKFLGRLDEEGKLAKTILYNLNPRDNEVIATMIGNFQDGSVPGKMQFGSGWWFLDQIDGMTRQMTALANLGLLSRFVGMLTDSRSFLSYPRHEYFRRLLCNLLGGWMRDGLLPRDYALVGEMVKAISYNNAATYFGFNLQPIP